MGLLSNGSEPTKGAPLQKQSFKLLQKASDAGRINFIGNVEGTDVMAGGVDVVVTDGFTGNVFLKASEGMIKSPSASSRAFSMPAPRTSWPQPCSRTTFSP